MFDYLACFARNLPLSLTAAALLTTAGTAIAEAPRNARQLPPLPEGLASFGAALLDGRAYVYSGHTGQAHAHSIDNLSKRFQSLDLNQPAGWQELAMGPPLQSSALVAHGKFLYRVGGLSARNKADEEEDLHSTADVARFDPARNRWESLAPLPAPRSSHDCAVLGDHLYAIGGWNLGEDRHWHTSALRMDLSQEQPRWEELPAPPFQRRALAVVGVGNKVYALGGMTPDAGPSCDVHRFDTANNSWSAAPALPGEGHNGFGCAACVLDGRLYVSTMGGMVYCLASDGGSWEPVGKLDPPRFFHRMLPLGNDTLLCIGGAGRGGHLTRVERVPLEALSADNDQPSQASLHP